MNITSKIKTMMSPEVLDRLASLCDTKKIPSNVEKMIICAKILKQANLTFSILGGATNRLVVQINGYAFKIAIDTQGYKDNFMEFSICKELHHVSKSYETNGYVLVAQCVRLMTDEEWSRHKGDILRILDSLSHDYLLGDVGYLEKNKTNWGITDDDEVVILDYAYCHRATENLFTCEVCGEGILTYDQSYDFLMCNNRTVCQARFTYNERKRIQGDEVDLNMIEECKNQSIIMSGDTVTQTINNVSGSTLLDNNTVVIHNEYELMKFKEEENMAHVDYDDELDMRTIIDIASKINTDPEGAKLMIDTMIEPSEKCRPPRNYVFADDYQEAISRPIKAKPADMMFGETWEEYEDRKARDEKESAEMGNTNVDDTVEEVRDGSDVNIDSIEDIIDLLDKKRGSGEFCNEPEIGGEFHVPVRGGLSVIADKLSAMNGNTGKVFVDDKEIVDK